MNLPEWFYDLSPETRGVMLEELGELGYDVSRHIEMVQDEIKHDRTRREAR